MNIPREKLEQWRGALSRLTDAVAHPDNVAIGRDALSSIEAELEQPQQPVHLMVGGSKGSYLTVVYRDIQPGDEARSLLEHPKMSAASWSHALRERDEARATAPESPQAAAQSTAQWVMVPREPTPEMVKAAMMTLEGGWCEATPEIRECGVIAEMGISQADADAINAECGKEHANFYRAMLAAAPSAQSTAQEPVAWLWQHSETGRTRIVMPDSVITADANWIVVGPLCLVPSAAMALLGDVQELVQALDNYATFPASIKPPLDRLRARIEALTGTGRKEQSNG